MKDRQILHVDDKLLPVMLITTFPVTFIPGIVVVVMALYYKGIEPTSIPLTLSFKVPALPLKKFA
jgi:hypothetical protein